MNPQVILSKGASEDITALAVGQDRADVALNALRSEKLSPGQINALTALAATYNGHRSHLPPRARAAGWARRFFQRWI